MHGHGLDALAISWPDQTCDIGRAHFTPRLVTKTFQIRDEPLLKIRLPVFFQCQLPSKLAHHESRNQPHGNPKKYTSAKVVLDTCPKNGGHLSLEYFFTYAAFIKCKKLLRLRGTYIKKKSQIINSKNHFGINADNKGIIILSHTIWMKNILKIRSQI